ncbi:MAG: hypothetical protein JW982_05590 [Spirochaetes bacterium]|nr:hypothetical protein [Spirochaetota bacterium]
MKKIILIILIFFPLLSCEDQLTDVYNDGKVYNLGDKGPGGGYVFYINPDFKKDGWKYMEAIEVNASFCWSDSSALLGVYGEAIGTGKANTNRIVQLTLTATDCAARLCRNFNGGSYSDWFLPSIDECEQIYLHLVLPGPLLPNNYWTSTEIDNTNAYFFQTSGAGAGSPSPNAKANPAVIYGVRCF